MHVLQNSRTSVFQSFVCVMLYSLGINAINLSFNQNPFSPTLPLSFSPASFPFYFVECRPSRLRSFSVGLPTSSEGQPRPAKAAKTTTFSPHPQRPHKWPVRKQSMKVGHPKKRRGAFMNTSRLLPSFPSNFPGIILTPILYPTTKITSLEVVLELPPLLG